MKERYKPESYTVISDIISRTQFTSGNFRKLIILIYLLLLEAASPRKMGVEGNGDEEDDGIM